ncbi:PREDICTED: transcription factor SOX-9-like isoform X1 [Chinchilla lanigera]|uniref:transcription factor SOX-9-like isoform X1 n=1 Tax=Chinchilla lanigera TaxID=34839 RepID=UPI00038EB6D6|nr:PREDICTED: transcription factor SOX-9-like isoform X1 [Chinchilla lanigera]
MGPKGAGAKAAGAKAAGAKAAGPKPEGPTPEGPSAPPAPEAAPPPDAPPAPPAPEQTPTQTQEELDFYAPNHRGQREERLGTSLCQLSPNWLAGCMRHTHWFRPHLWIGPIFVKPRHSMTGAYTPIDPPAKTLTSRHARNSKADSPANKKPTNQGT